ncbi:MAG: PAS domain-containing protein [Patescibacteria group bacterium]
MDKKLSEEQKKFEAIYQHSHDAIMLLTEKGFFDCNRRTLEMFGFKTVEDFSKVHPADISPSHQPDGRESFPAAMGHIKIALKNGHDHFEWVHKKTNGENFYADVLLSSFPYEGENVLQATVRDITQHKMREQELLKLRKAVEASGEIIFTTDRDGIITYINPEFTHMYGHNEGEVIGKVTPRILKSGKLKKEDYKYVWDTITQGKVFKSSEIINKTKDGRFLTIEGSINPITDENGVINGFLAIQRDITNHKSEEEVMKKEKEQDQVLLDSVPAWIFFKDKENRFVQVNKSFCEAVSKTKEELEGKSLFDLYPKEQAEMYWKDDKEVMASGRAKMNIIESITTPKGLLWVQTDKIPFRNTEGDIVGIIGFSIDITAQKKAEEETKKKNEEMERVNTLMVGRELKMIELKKKITALEEKINKLEK